MTVSVSPLVLSLNVPQRLQSAQVSHGAASAGLPEMVWPRLDVVAGAPLLDAPEMPGSVPQSPTHGGNSGVLKPQLSASDLWLGRDCEERDELLVPEDDQAVHTPHASAAVSPGLRAAGSRPSSPLPALTAGSAAPDAPAASEEGLAGHTAGTQIVRWVLGDLCEQLLQATSGVAVERLLRACEATARQRMDELQALYSQLAGGAGCIGSQLEGNAVSERLAEIVINVQKETEREPDEEPHACMDELPTCVSLDELPAGSPGIAHVPTTMRLTIGRGRSRSPGCRFSGEMREPFAPLTELERCRPKPPSPRELPPPAALMRGLVGCRCPSQPVARPRVARCRRAKSRSKSTGNSRAQAAGVQADALRLLHDSVQPDEATAAFTLLCEGRAPLSAGSRGSRGIASRDKLSSTRMQEAQVLLAEMLTPCGGVSCCNSIAQEPGAFSVEVPTPRDAASCSKESHAGPEPKLAAAAQAALALRPLNGSMPWFPAVEQAPPKKEQWGRLHNRPGEQNGHGASTRLQEQLLVAKGMRQEEEGFATDEEFCKLLSQALASSDGEGSP
mmetsp:Transcript_96842/g.269317  ORF Transcript_96842/g.269317 Transcript_96842/m.269317 type:complete len:560 (+) Transcript_96842:139-1818(+)